MKMVKKMITSMLVIAMLFGLSSGTAYAASTNDKVVQKLSTAYEYTVTFSAGNHGTFKSANDIDENMFKVTQKDTSKIAPAVDVKENSITITKLQAGDTIFFAAQLITDVKQTEDSKIYYVKGTRESGLDNAAASQTLSLTVDSDQDYVVAYGIKGEQIPYTVHYQLANGKTLSASQTFQGNIGDKPIVFYKFINGYVPVVKAYTQTLDDPNETYEFTFVYEKAPSQKTKTEVTTHTIYADGGTTTTGSSTAGGSSSSGGTTAAATPAEGTATGGTGEATEETPETPAEPETEEPAVEEEEIVDLDEEETPLADIDLDDKTAGESSNSELYAALGGVALAVVLLAAFLIAKARKKEE